jgi:lysophospholipase L1-like esterase
MLVSGCSVLGCGSGIAPLPALNVPQTNDVIFIGDSITTNWAQDPGFQAHTNWINKGISGQTSFRVALRFGKDVISSYPKTVHILVGTNDVYPGWHPCVAPSSAIADPEDICSNILYMVQLAQHYGIKVVIGTIPPWGCADNPFCGQSAADKTTSRYDRIVEYNRFLEEFAAKYGVTIVDYHTILEDATDLHYAQGLTLDGVHPSQKGYELMTPAVTAALQ